MNRKARRAAAKGAKMADEAKSKKIDGDLAVRLSVDGDLSGWEARTEHIAIEPKMRDVTEMFSRERMETRFQVSGSELAALVRLASAGFAASVCDADTPPNLRAIEERCYDTPEMRKANRAWAQAMPSSDFGRYMLQEARSDIFHLVSVIEQARKALAFYEREKAAREDADNPARGPWGESVTLTSLADPHHALAELRKILGSA